jgi:hypothetical protein
MLFDIWTRETAELWRLTPGCRADATRNSPARQLNYAPNPNLGLK